jgi:hypothetical protein
MTQSVTNIIIAAAAVIGLIQLGIAAAPAQGCQKKTGPPFPALGTTTSVEVHRPRPPARRQHADDRRARAHTTRTGRQPCPDPAGLTRPPPDPGAHGRHRRRTRRPRRRFPRLPPV